MSVCLSVCHQLTDITDITSKRNVMRTDTTGERNVQDTDIKSERNVQGTEECTA